MSGLNGTVCTPEEQYLSNNFENNYSIYCLTRGQSIGLTLTVESGIISLLAVLLVFLLLVVGHHTYLGALHPDPNYGRLA